MRKLKKSELKRVYGGGRALGTGHTKGNNGSTNDGDTDHDNSGDPTNP